LHNTITKAINYLIGSIFFLIKYVSYFIHFLAFAFQSFYGFKDLPIYVNQWPNIYGTEYGTELLGTTTGYTRHIDTIKKELT
jgi:uncharacterized membrane protein required for colicin V production